MTLMALFMPPWTTFTNDAFSGEYILLLSGVFEIDFYVPEQSFVSYCIIFIQHGPEFTLMHLSSWEPSLIHDAKHRFYF